MGGKKKRGLGGIVNSVANVAVKGTTGGMLSTDGSGWGEKLARGDIKTTDDILGAGTDAAISAGGGAGLMEAQKVMTPDIELPEAPDPLAQEAAANEEAKKKLATVGKGVAGTILGGSLGDNANIRKKKLLGE